jgi:glutamine synthetase
MMPVAQFLERLHTCNTRQLRLAWCDVHGRWHSKTLLANAWDSALADGVRAASSLALKDSSGRTAFPVFDAQAMQRHPMLAEFALVGDMLWKPDLSRATALPHHEATMWVACTAHSVHDLMPLEIDPVQVLTRAINALQARGYRMQVGIELEFHVWRCNDFEHPPHELAWPGNAPQPDQLKALHPGFQLLSDASASACQTVFDVVARVCSAVGLPLLSLEIEMGPSQFELVGGPQDALRAAHCMAALRGLLPQALREHGFLCSFMCRPPWEPVMASGWHIHHSWVHEGSGENAFATSQGLSDLARHVIAGELAHASATAAVAVPTVNGYRRVQAGALAPQRINWGPDSRGALLRVLDASTGTAAASTRIEHRLAEPQANPYLVLAALIYAGLDGLERKLPCPAPTGMPGAPSGMPDAPTGMPGAPTGKPDAPTAQALPTSPEAALKAWQESTLFQQAFGSAVVDWFAQLQWASLARHQAALQRADSNPAAQEQASLRWQHQEYLLAR